MKYPTSAKEFYNLTTGSLGYVPVSSLIDSFSKPSSPLLIVESIDLSNNPAPTEDDDLHLGKTLEFKTGNAAALSPIEQIAIEVTSRGVGSVGTGVYLGRIRSCDIVVPIKSISKVYLMFSAIGDEWYLTCMKDTNPAKMRGSEIKIGESYELYDDSLISLANESAQVRFLTPQGWIYFKDAAKSKGEKVKPLVVT